MKFLYIKTLLTILLIASPCSKSTFTGRYYKNHGILVEPTGYTVHPLGHAYLTILILFDHPHIQLKSNKLCDANITNYSKELRSYSRAYLSEVTSLMTTQEIPDILKPCQVLPDFCENNNMTDDTTKSSRQKRFLPFIALAAGISALGISIYNTISRHQVATAINDLSDNQALILDRINKHTDQVNNLIKISQDLFISIESYRKYIDGRLSKLTCVVSSQLDYIYYLGQIQNLHSRFERVIASLYHGQLTPDMISPSLLKEIMTDHHLLKNTILSKDMTLTYKLARLTVLGYTRNHMGVTVLVKLPILQGGDISPVLHTTNVGWTYQSVHVKLDVPIDSYLITDQDQITLIEINKDNCELTSGIWVCESMAPRTSHASTCLASIVLTKPVNDVKENCKKLIRQIPQQDIIESTSGLLVLGKVQIRYIRHIRGRITTGEFRLLNSINYTFVPFKKDQAIEVNGITYNSLNDPIIVSIDNKDHNTVDFYDDLLDALGDNWKDPTDVQEELSNLNKNKLGHLSLSFPHLQDSINGVVIIGIIIVMVLGVGKYINYRKTSLKGISQQKSVLYHKNLNSLDIRPI